MRIIVEGEEKFIGKLLKENRIRFSRKELSWHEESCEVKNDTGSEELTKIEETTIVAGDLTGQNTDEQKESAGSEKVNAADKKLDETDKELGADMYSDPDFSSVRYENR